MTDREKFLKACKYISGLMDGDTHFIDEMYVWLIDEGMVDKDSHEFFFEQDDWTDK